jgi:putative transcriptional regulator
MNNYAGKILISNSSMDDPFFKQSVLFITEHNQQGAMAFVINKTFERPLNELKEFNSSPAFPLFSGGPVDTAHLYFIHRRNDLIPGGTQIIDDIYLGGDFKQAIAHINKNTIKASAIKIFIGYCGWDAMELEAEIAEGSWNVVESAEEVLFD